MINTVTHRGIAFGNESLYKKRISYSKIVTADRADLPFGDDLYIASKRIKSRSSGAKILGFFTFSLVF